MKLETKKIIEKIIIFFSPVFTLIMFMLPTIALVKQKTIYNSGVYEHQEYVSYIEALKINGHIFSKIIMWTSLIGVIATMILYILSTILKEKEKLLIKIGGIVLVASTGVLLVTMVESYFVNVSFTGAKNYSWIDFLTPVYGLLLAYNVISLIYYLNNISKKEISNKK